MKMKNPNGYGGIVDLGKNRRRPIAVRVPNGVKLTEDCREIPQYKYLGYFERTPQGKKDAQLLLAQYNAGRRQHLNTSQARKTVFPLLSKINQPLMKLRSKGGMLRMRLLN